MAKKAASLSTVSLKKGLISTKISGTKESSRLASKGSLAKAGKKGSAASKGTAKAGTKLLKRGSVKAKLPASKTSTSGKRAQISRVGPKSGASAKSSGSSKLLAKRPAATSSSKLKPAGSRSKISGLSDELNAPPSKTLSTKAVAGKPAATPKAIPLKPIPSGPPKIHSKIQMRVETRWADLGTKDASNEKVLQRPEVAPLKKKEIDQLKELLVVEKNKLLRHLEEVSQSSEEHLETNVISGDAADIASLEMTQANLQKIGKREGYLLKKIDAALEKIQQGTYGACESCGEPISFARLQARPVAQLCIDCKTLQENEERRFSTRERGDEDDSEVPEDGEEG